MGATRPRAAILVHGVHGAVGGLAEQLAAWRGTVIATIRRGET